MTPLPSLREFRENWGGLNGLLGSKWADSDDEAMMKLHPETNHDPNKVWDMNCYKR